MIDSLNEIGRQNAGEKVSKKRQDSSWVGIDPWVWTVAAVINV